jgi:hypothetical protein
MDIENIDEQLTSENISGEAERSNPDLQNDIKHLKSDTVNFFRDLLKSWWVKIWLRIFFFAALFALLLVVFVTLFNILFCEEPKPLFISIWEVALESMENVFAVIGFFWVFIRAILKLWEERG